MVTLARTSAKRIPGMAGDLRSRTEAVVVRGAMPRVRGREQRRGTRNRAARPERVGKYGLIYQRILDSGHQEVRRDMAGFGRSSRCRPATDQPLLVSCPRATRPPPPSADGAAGGPLSRPWLSWVRGRLSSSEFPRKSRPRPEWEPLRRNPVVSAWLPSRRNSGTLRDRYRQAFEGRKKQPASIIASRMFAKRVRFEGLGVPIARTTIGRRDRSPPWRVRRSEQRGATQVERTSSNALENRTDTGFEPADPEF
jgi:hypothetical protein